MTEQRKGLTWSKKWHIVDESKSHPNYDIAICGAYLYNEVKEKARYRGAKLPEHLQRIINGTLKSTGNCKLCYKSAGGPKTVEVELPKPTPDDWNTNVWIVPLHNPYTGEVEKPGGHAGFLGQVDIRKSDGKISVTSTPSKLETSGDARRLAAALLAAADRKDELDAHSTQD